MRSLKACGNCIWYSHNTQELGASWVIDLTNTSFSVFLCLTYKFNLMLSHFHPTKWCNGNSLFIHATKHQCILLQTLYILQQVHTLITVFQCSCGCLNLIIIWFILLIQNSDPTTFYLAQLNQNRYAGFHIIHNNHHAPVTLPLIFTGK